MKLSDYVIEYLAKNKIHKVFLITGGAVAHLVDSFLNIKGITCVCNQNEQASAMAAEAYARLTGNIGVAMATSGPGATNLITGMCCAWFDSIPNLYITGQVNTSESRGNTKVRQVGFQETDIVSIVKPVTKLAVQVTDPEKIKYYLDKAFYIAKSGRPGPVLLDIPMNIQRAEINPAKLQGFDTPKKYLAGDNVGVLKKKVSLTLKLMDKAKRPVIIVGGGIKLANAQKEVKEFIKKTGFPVVTSWSGFDTIPFNHTLLVGQYGVYGNRGANFVVQNSDLIVSIGSRLDTRQTGGRPDTFAREAKKIVVDIDQSELDKRRGLVPDIAICSDAKRFLGIINKELADFRSSITGDWLKRAKVWKTKYPGCLPEYYKQKGSVNPYVFIKTLSQELKKNAIIIPDAGGNLTWTLQSFEIKDGQSLFSAFGNSPMGYSVAAGIGAAFAVNNKRPVISIIGDGGIQINIQELQTLFHYKIPVKVFILNNHSYGIIKQFQDMYFTSRHIAVSPESGYSSPDFIKVANAYGLKAISIKSHRELQKKVKEALKFRGPVICDVFLKDGQKLIPKLEFGKSIEDLSPYLSRKEFKENMIIDPL